MHTAPETDLDPGSRRWALPDRSLCAAADRGLIEQVWKRIERGGRRHALCRLRAWRGEGEGAREQLLSWAERVFVDHAFLRTVHPNRHEIAPGVFRSAQPSPRHIGQMARRGVRTVVNLRGARDCASYLAERRACDRHGIALVDFPLASRQPPRADRLLALCGLFAATPHPMLMHCKSGSDRVGLASAVYLLHRDPAALAEARGQLSLRYGHIARSRTGVLGAVIDTYIAAYREHGVGFCDWLARDYDPEGLLQAFRANRVAAYVADSVLRRE